MIGIQRGQNVTLYRLGHLSTFRQNISRIGNVKSLFGVVVCKFPFGAMWWIVLAD